MKTTYTSAEVRAVLHVDAKTFLRWLEQAGIQPHISKADHRTKLFTREQVEQLAKAHERSLPAEVEEQPATDEWIEALETRMSVLEALQRENAAFITRIKALEEKVRNLEQLVHQRPQPRTPSPRPASLRPTRLLHHTHTSEAAPEIPAGAVQYWEFAATHKVKVTTFRDQLERGHVPFFKRAKPHRPREMERWLTPADQAAAIRFWKREGTPYKPCEACPHTVI